ncbi:hypothetical protein N7486_002157 [Penicillium sp. IBT 16267x]|nr:hypothetical protein N7486_002157 [Penicillium sp. IBT 16267x]
MGGWDVYCAICGSTFDSRLSIDSDDETDATYSGEVIGQSDLKWLETLCALGINSNIPGERKSFITGQGSSEDAGYISVARGNDPNVPLDERGEVSGLCAYHDYTQEYLIVFPFHEVCYKDILLRCFKKEKINEDVLYALFEEMRQDRHNALALDYGDPIPPYDQYWECRKGEEVLVTHPVDIPQLAIHLGIIPELLADVEKKSSESRTVQDKYDIFDKLSFELREMIFNLLPIASVLAIKAASFSMHATPCESWRQKLETDMPWLWEVHDIDPFKSQEMEARFSKMFEELEKKSRYNKETFDYIPGLVNRRRIWVVCEDIRSLYHDKLAEAQGHQLDRTANLAATRALFATFKAENPNSWDT